MTPVTNEVYPKASHSIGVFFDTGDPEQEQHLRVLENAFGDRYAISEDIQGSLYRYLDLRPGGLREKRR